MKKYQNKYRIPSARLPYWDYTNNGAYFITICTKNRNHYFGEIIKPRDPSPTDVAMQLPRTDVAMQNISTDVAMQNFRTDVAVQRLYPSKKTTPTNTMQLNEIGQLAHNYWNDIPNHFPHVQLGNFVIMPDHMHGILIINKSVETLQCNVSTKSGKIKNKKMSKISPKPGSIPTIIRSYKSEVTKKARKINSEFTWHSRFYDHIIRDKFSFNAIQQYIVNNPANWLINKKSHL